MSMNPRRSLPVFPASQSSWRRFPFSVALHFVSRPLSNAREIPLIQRPRYAAGRSNTIVPSALVSSGITNASPAGTFEMMSPTSRSSLETTPSSIPAFRPTRSQENRVPLGAEISRCPFFERRVWTFRPRRAISDGSTELASRSIARHASRSNPYAAARCSVAYPRAIRAPRRRFFSARSYQPLLYPVNASHLSLPSSRIFVMSAGPGMNTYASAASTAFHSWSPTCPSFAFGRVAMERQTVGSSSNRSIGRAPAARNWYTNSAAIGRPWFQHSTITFSFGFTRSVFLITFFARDSYSDIVATGPQEKHRGALTMLDLRAGWAKRYDRSGVRRAMALPLIRWILIVVLVAAGIYLLIFHTAPWKMRR